MIAIDAAFFIRSQKLTDSLLIEMQFEHTGDPVAYGPLRLSQQR